MRQSSESLQIAAVRFQTPAPNPQLWHGLTNAGAVMRSFLPRDQIEGLAHKLARMARADGTFDTPPCIRALVGGQKTGKRWRRAATNLYRRPLSPRRVRQLLNELEALGVVGVDRSTGGDPDNRTRVIWFDREALHEDRLRPRMTILGIQLDRCSRRRHPPKPATVPRPDEAKFQGSESPDTPEILQGSTPEMLPSDTPEILQGTYVQGSSVERSVPAPAAAASASTAPASDATDQQNPRAVARDTSTGPDENQTPGSPTAAAPADRSGAPRCDDRQGGRPVLPPSPTRGPGRGPFKAKTRAQRRTQAFAGCRHEPRCTGKDQHRMRGPVYTEPDAERARLIAKHRTARAEAEQAAAVAYDELDAATRAQLERQAAEELHAWSDRLRADVFAARVQSKVRSYLEDARARAQISYR